MKRKTKEQREAEQRAALLQRITDVYSGAVGQVWAVDDWANAEILSTVIPALQGMFGKQVNGTDYAFQNHCLKYFDTPQSACDHLFDLGFRA